MRPYKFSQPKFREQSRRKPVDSSGSGRTRLRHPRKWILLIWLVPIFASIYVLANAGTLFYKKEAAKQPPSDGFFQGLSSGSTPHGESKRNNAQPSPDVLSNPNVVGEQLSPEQLVGRSNQSLDATDFPSDSFSLPNQSLDERTMGTGTNRIDNQIPPSTTRDNDPLHPNQSVSQATPRAEQAPSVEPSRTNRQINPTRQLDEIPQPPSIGGDVSAGNRSDLNQNSRPQPQLITGQKQPSQQNSQPNATQANTELVPIYFVKIDNARAHFIPVRRNVDSAEKLQETIEYLLAGPDNNETERGLMQFIPQKTELLGLRKQGRRLVLNLNDNFLFSDPTNSRIKIAQIVATLTAIEEISEIEFLINGVHVDFLDNEGLIPNKIMTRDNTLRSNS